MKQILKPIFEIVTGEYILFDNIIYNYIAMAIIGLIAYRIAWKCVRKLYNNYIISGKGIGSITHWTIRLIVFSLIFYVCSFSIWITKFIYTYKTIILGCAIGIIIIIITIKIIKNNKKIKKFIGEKILAIKRRIALFELEKFNQYKTIYLFISLLILIILICIISKLLVIIDFELKVDNIYSDTGIALIGMVALIFSLNTYKQQILYKYMNSVMDKILNDKKYDILQYIVVVIISILFIFMSNIICNNYISTSIYICCLTYIFILFGLDLVVISNKLDKVKIIKECEKKIKVTTKCLEKEYKIIKKYTERNNQKIESDIRFMEVFNQIYTAYVQCINMIVRDNINDTIAFREAMQVYVNIAKERLERRKNKITHLEEPLLAEIISTGENDIFIEKYILEYLQEYSKIALKEKNRDIISIIQKTYYTLIILGSENKYINNKDNIELTIKIILTYYLNNIRDIVELNNENLLFETTEIMQEIFIKNGEKYVSLIDGMYIDKVVEICKEAINQESEINLRNSIELLIIPIYTLLKSETKYQRVKLEMIYKALEKILTLLTTNIKFIKKYNEARIALNHMFNCLEPISICNIYRNYYNFNIVKDNKINKDILYKKDIFDELLDFLEKEETIKNVAFLRKTNYYVTIDTDINAILELIIDISLRIINLNDEKLTKIYKKVLMQTLRIYNKYVIYYDKGIIQYEIDEFYKCIMIRNKNVIDDSMKEEIANMFLSGKLFYMREGKLNFNTFITYILCVIEIENEDKKKENINKIITMLTNDDMKNKINLFIKIKKHYRPFEKEEITRVYKYCSIIMEEQLKDELTTLKKEEIVEILSRNNIEYKQDLKKEDLINLIFEQKPEIFSGI
ncbi:MAG TPA: hypothetical protein OIM49_02560 [Clostridiaceae bacterium]|nr:hypothetical protein [Clostridiaceae bacterium]